MASEDRAVRELRGRGYEILERNFRCKLGELDVVARDGDTLVFVEVRSRGSAAFGDALAQIGTAKQRQVTRVAQVWLRARGQLRARCRFDVVGVTGGEVALVRDAWRPGLP